MNRRRWFQIHLSTAIVLMFVAGGLIYLNTELKTIDEPIEAGRYQLSIQKRIDKVQFQGWPLHARTYYFAGHPVPVAIHNQLSSCVIDALAALAILIACTVSCETLTNNRREARRP